MGHDWNSKAGGDMKSKRRNQTSQVPIQSIFKPSDIPKTLIIYCWTFFSENQR
jgi:hypothetical protein